MAQPEHPVAHPAVLGRMIQRVGPTRAQFSAAARPSRHASQSSEATMALDAPQDGLVEVFDTQDEPEAMVVKGLLESAGIPVVVGGLDAPPTVLPGVGGIMVRVPPERADEARGIIEARNNPLPND